MKLDPQVSALLTAISAAGMPSVDKVPVDFARRMVESSYAQVPCPVKPVFSTDNVVVPTLDGNVPVRIYKPSDEESLPILVFIHGGGWVLFHLDHYDSMCTHLCTEAGCIVVSVEYRRSPEYKFPAALNDCLEVVRWVEKNASSFGGDASKVIVGGDSAGGNLAAVVPMALRDRGGLPLCGQLLIYPTTDYFDPPSPSMLKFADGYSLTYDALRWFWDHYLQDKSDAMNPYVSPLKAKDLSGLPDAFVMVSGFDPLCDEAVNYACRLKEAGNQVRLSRYEDMIHGFISYLGVITRANDAIAEIGIWLKTQFNR